MAELSTAVFGENYKFCAQIRTPYTADVEYYDFLGLLRRHTYTYLWL